MSIELLEACDFSSEKGFLGSGHNISCLPDPYYAPWELAMKNLANSVRDKSVRRETNLMPLLFTLRLGNKAAHRRAYTILSCLMQAYVWEDDGQCDLVLPASITIPLLAVSSILKMPPVATYASLCLWNWQLKRPHAQVELDNLTTISTITGTWDESWFYLVSVAIEAKGAQAIRNAYAFYANDCDSQSGVATALHTLRANLVDMKCILLRMYENCQADVFYHVVRPKLQGMSSIARASGTNGIMCDTGFGQTKLISYNGPSNGQSSLLQVLDLLLGVDHFSSRLASPDEQSSAKWLLDMRSFMPWEHREYLRVLTDQTKHRRAICDLVQRDRILLETCVAALKDLRITHREMVSDYLHQGCEAKDLFECRQSLRKIRQAREECLGGITGTGGTPGEKILEMLDRFTSDTELRADCLTKS